MYFCFLGVVSNPQCWGLIPCDVLRGHSLWCSRGWLSTSVVSCLEKKLSLQLLSYPESQSPDFETKCWDHLDLGLSKLKKLWTWTHKRKSPWWENFPFFTVLCSRKLEFIFLDCVAYSFFVLFSSFSFSGPCLADDTHSLLLALYSIAPGDVLGTM